MTRFRDLSCGCGTLPHPLAPDIPAGLWTLVERQTAGFPEYREAMLRAIRNHAALADWRARGESDLGVMLLEAWAYVLDVTGFYDARIAERGYLGTAPDEVSAQRLTMLIGHRPRPAIAARVTLAAEADGSDPVLLPKGTAFRSEPFDGEPPQIFELAGETLIWPQRNLWRLAPVREDAFGETLRFAPRRGPHPGAIVLVWSESGVAVAVRIEEVQTEQALDGATYLLARVEEDTSSGLASLTGEKLSGLRAAALRLPLGMTGFTTVSANGATIDRFESDSAADTTSVVLDGLYSQVRPGARAVTEIGGFLSACQVLEVETATVTVDATAPATAPATRVTLEPALTWNDGEDFTLHVDPVALGRPTRPAQTGIQLADIVTSGALVPPIAELGDAPTAGDLIVRGARAKGELVAGTIDEQGDGAASFVPDADTSDFAAALATPVRLYGNSLSAVRGRTVTDEVLGSGNAAAPFNRFQPKKKPLAWVEDASAPNGRRPELTVRVDGLVWDWVDSFFRHGPEERVYVVRPQPDGESSIVFGDGARGARVPTGVENVRADYRYGAGAAKPPAGTVNQIVAPVKGLARIRGPLAPVGGADPETAGELRDSAPAGALTLGRAISLADFEALARQFSGILNAAAGWAWDAGRQRAAVKIWFIPDAGDPGNELAGWLSARAAPDLAIAVEPAGITDPGALAVTLDIAADHSTERVREDAAAALFDAKTGLLAARNVRIGAPLYRSVVSARLQQVAGVTAVRSILLGGLPMPYAVDPIQGNWLDLAATATLT